eukprot:GAFH01001283.1.p5 GENE.GAFH01001283.1~~GAFH01001283.1.p5  ORF type:complete len:87 (-),score=14.62 GAFH01001283.1:825-1085(-)
MVISCSCWATSAHFKNPGSDRGGLFLQKAESRSKSSPYCFPTSAIASGGKVAIGGGGGSRRRKLLIEATKSGPVAQQVVRGRSSRG